MKYLELTSDLTSPPPQQPVPQSNDLKAKAVNQAGHQVKHSSTSKEETLWEQSRVDSADQNRVTGDR